MLARPEWYNNIYGKPILYLLWWLMRFSIYFVVHYMMNRKRIWFHSFGLHDSLGFSIIFDVLRFCDIFLPMCVWTLFLSAFRGPITMEKRAALFPSHWLSHSVLPSSIPTEINRMKAWNFKSRTNVSQYSFQIYCDNLEVIYDVFREIMMLF